MLRGKPNAQRSRHFIGEWRKYKGCTLEEIAKVLDVTPFDLSQLEQGEIGYTQPLLEALANAFQIQPADLLSRDPSEPETICTLLASLTPQQHKRAVAVLRAYCEGHLRLERR